MDTFWHKQRTGEPLFPELVWSRPENRSHAGKLLLIGGNGHGFAAPAEAYAESVKAGAGTVHALLPDTVKKYVGIIIEHASYAPSTPSGSFSQKALTEFLHNADWADGVLLPGDLGRNSETAIVLESFLGKTDMQCTLTRDAADYVITSPHIILDRPNTLLVVSLSQLQRLAIASGFHRPIAFKMDLVQLVNWLYDFTKRYPLGLIVRHLNTTFVAVKGEVSTTPVLSDKPVWRLRTACHAAVWWMQNPSRPFAALTTAIATIQGRNV